MAALIRIAYLISLILCLTICPFTVLSILVKASFDYVQLSLLVCNEPLDHSRPSSLVPNVAAYGGQHRNRRNDSAVPGTMGIAQGQRGLGSGTRTRSRRLPHEPESITSRKVFIYVLSQFLTTSLQDGGLIGLTSRPLAERSWSKRFHSSILLIGLILCLQETRAKVLVPATPSFSSPARLRFAPPSYISSGVWGSTVPIHGNHPPSATPRKPLYIFLASP